MRYQATSTALYGDPRGHPGLREAVAQHLGASRAVRAAADDIVVTNGAQQALDLIGRVLLEPGDRVVVEDPGYPPARMLFRSQGADVTGVPVDDEGIVVDAIPEDTRLIYVTPSHQLPLGMPVRGQVRPADGQQQGYCRQAGRLSPNRRGTCRAHAHETGLHLSCADRRLDCRTQQPRRLQHSHPA